MRLERLLKVGRDAKRIDAAMAIYQRTILPEARNPEREILYWIEHSERGGANELFCFAIEDQGKVVGYLQYSYFASAECAFLEYICVAKDARVYGTDALAAFKHQLSSAHPTWKAVVGELAFQKGPANLWREDATLLRLAGRYGFGRLDMPYHYPALNASARELSHPADLVVMLRNGSALDVAAALQIVRSIYFDHYLAWDRPFMPADKLAERQRLFDELYSQQVAAAGERVSIGIHAVAAT
jgi:hypothetical protein